MNIYQTKWCKHRAHHTHHTHRTGRTLFNSSHPLTWVLFLFRSFAIYICRTFDLLRRTFYIILNVTTEWGVRWKWFCSDIIRFTISPFKPTQSSAPYVYQMYACTYVHNIYIYIYMRTYVLTLRASPWTYTINSWYISSGPLLH